MSESKFTPPVLVEERVEIPGWGAFLAREANYPAMLRIKKAHDLISVAQDEKGDSSDAETDALLVVISECLHTEAGERAFAKPADVPTHPWRSFQAAADAARRVCLLLPDEEVKKPLGESEGDPTSG